MSRPFFIGLLAVGVLSACDGGSSDANSAETSAGTEGAAAQKSTLTTLPEGTGPAAVVNGVEVDREVFNREYTQTMERYAKARHDVRPSLKERLKDNIVRRLVDMEVIRQQAEKMGVSLSQAEKDKRWTEHRKRYGTDEAFKAFLERAGTTEKDIRRQFDANLLREKVFGKVASEVSVTDKEVRAFYEENLNRYTEPEQVRARHILIRKPPNADAEQVAELEKKAEKISKEVTRKNTDFAELAKKYSEDVTKSRGGDLGWFAKGRMVKPFETAAWKLKKGEISDVVETTFGFHIIKKEDHKEARTKPFKEVEPLIRRSLVARKRNQAIQDSIKAWRKDAKIELFVKGDPEIIKQDAPKARPKPNNRLKVAPSPPVDPKTGKLKRGPAPGERTGPPKQ